MIRRRCSWPAAGVTGALLALLLGASTLAGCIAITVPVYRIGVVLPLEGRYREVGYDVFYASRVVILKALQVASGQPYRVELVIYDDFGEPGRAVAPAEALARDPSVLAVVGHWRPDTTAAAVAVYQSAELPLITAHGDAVRPGTPGVYVLDARPEERQAALNAYLSAHSIQPASVYQAESSGSVTEAAALALASEAPIRIGYADWGLSQFRALIQEALGNHDGQFWFITNAVRPADLPAGALLSETIVRQTIDTGDPILQEPGPYAPLAYDSITLALEAIRRASAAGPLTRQTVAQAIAAVDVDGYTGHISFGPDGFRREAPLYLYRWGDESAPVLLERLP